MMRRPKRRVHPMPQGRYADMVTTTIPRPTRKKVTRPEFAELLGLTNVESIKQVRGLPAPDAPPERVNGRWVTCWWESTAKRFAKSREAAGAGRGWRKGRIGDRADDGPVDPVVAAQRRAWAEAAAKSRANRAAAAAAAKTVRPRRGA